MAIKLEEDIFGPCELPPMLGSSAHILPPVTNHATSANGIKMFKSELTNIRKDIATYQERERVVLRKLEALGSPALQARQTLIESGEFWIVLIRNANRAEVSYHRFGKKAPGN